MVTYVFLYDGNARRTARTKKWEGTTLRIIFHTITSRSHTATLCWPTCGSWRAGFWDILPFFMRGWEIWSLHAHLLRRQSNLPAALIKDSDEKSFSNWQMSAPEYVSWPPGVNGLVFETVSFQEYLSLNFQVNPTYLECVDQPLLKDAR